MKQFILSFILLTLSLSLFSQDIPVKPGSVNTGKYLGVSKALRDIPAISASEYKALEIKAKNKQFNEKLKYRNYPFASVALPKGPDAAWQSSMGTTEVVSDNPLTNFDGQTSPYYPPDCNGTVGPNHFMQTINTIYSIYDKSGTLVAGPTNMNQLFGSVPGSNYNDGDPIILYDEQADRWFATEFSITGSTDYILMAVSTTNDPTGTWHQYSFPVASMPDYPKFSVWRDGYYMGDNNSSSNDIYVFQRDQILIGGTAQVIGFNNQWRPSSVDGFMCVPPVDNDGGFAPPGSPGLFIAFNDDAFGGGTDQLWIYELAVNWTTPTSSTFNRVQQIEVIPFDCNFGNNWNNIVQPGTSQKLDAIPQVIMNVPQYRNFGSYQTIVCCHVVDVDATNHAGIRWYELRKTSGTWDVRQTGTYAPDAHSRWMGSILLNNFNQIGLGYSISSSTEYPGIRYCGQSPASYSVGNGILDIPEDTIQLGTNSQTGANRWGDYAQLSIDPVDGKTFWFTTEFIGSGNSRKTKIASFTFVTNPTATTEAATNITGTSGQINGTIDPQGVETFYYFKYGEYAMTLNDSTSLIYAGSGMDTVNVSFVLNNLLISKKYYYRLVATYAGGKSTGSTLNFTTLNELPILSVVPPVQTVDLAAGVTDYFVTANTPWNVIHTASWNQITMDGNGNDTINAIFEENTTFSSRTDTITVSSAAGSQQVLLIQNGILPVLNVTPLNQNVGIQAGNTEFQVTSNVYWTAVSDAAWCLVSATGNGDGSFTAVFSENTTTSERIANITVSGIGATSVTVTVTQAGLAPVLTVTPAFHNVTALAGSVSFVVTSNTDWTISGDATWLNATPPSGSGNGTIVADYSTNNIGLRTANIVVSAIGVPPVQVSVIQAEPIGTEDLQTEEFAFYPNPADNNITVIPGKNQGLIVLTVMDLHGKIIFTKSLEGKKSYQVNLSELSEGLYNMIIKTTKEVRKEKLVIIR